MKNFKKVISILLMLVMITGLVACGKQGDDKKGNDKVTVAPTKKVTNTPTPTKVVKEPTPKPTPTPEVMPDKVDVSKIESKLAGKVTVNGTDFLVNDQKLFMNGVNTPWDKWNDFGGRFNVDFWSEHFKMLSEAGVNSTRIWITCNGDVGINIDANGLVTGATSKHWSDLDTLFTLAEENGIYIMATLISFDHFKDSNKNYLSWRKLVQDEKLIDSYIENYVIPFCERYDDFNSLWSIDLCNEPDWIVENKECGNLKFANIGQFFAKEAAAIHEHSDVLVTIGYGMIKYNSTKYTDNYGSDEFLKKCYDNEKAYLDFYSTHYYEWEAEWFGFPFDKTPVEFGLDGTKPCVIGEFPAAGFEGNVKNAVKMSATECYIGCYDKGWNGLMAWTSNGVDKCGSFSDIEAGVKAVAEKIKK